MNKVLKLALGAVLSVALVAPAFAQDNFPDVPENHWAYQALSNLKDKVLFGYPDGFYRGSRMMSRYEFAVAIDKLWKHMMGMFDDVNSKITALEGQVGKGGDTDGIMSQLNALKAQVNGMAGWEKSINDLQKLSGEFEKDLAALGVDVDAMKRDMSDLKSRVEALEQRKDTIKMGADVNMLILAGNSDSGNLGLLQDGTIVGTNGLNGGNLHTAGFTRDLTVMHDVNLNLSGDAGNGIKWNADLGIGNSFGTIGGFYGPTNGGGQGQPFGKVANTDIVFNTMYVTYDSSLVGQGMGVTVGRFGHQVSPYIWKRSDFTKYYYQNEMRGSGDWYMDGLMLNFNFGKAALKVFGGRNTNLLTTGGAEINQSFIVDPTGVNGAVSLDSTLGVQLDVPVGENGGVTLAYLWQDYIGANTVTINRRNVFGADAHFDFNNIKFHGAYAQSNVNYNTSTVVNNDNAAWDVGVGFNAGPVGVTGGYRRVEQNFTADGDWGRIGTFWNPTNIEGFNVGLKFSPSADLSLYGKGEFVDAIVGGAGVFANANDKATSYTLGANYKLSNSFDLGLKYENVEFDYSGTNNDPNLRWYSVMLGYNMADNAKLMFTYIFSDVDFKGNQGIFGFGNSVYKGGLLGTQLSVKF